MNKAKKIHALILGGLMATVVATGLGSADFHSAKADNLVTFTEVTSVDDLYVGATYIISGLKNSITYVMDITQKNNNRTSEIATSLEGKIIDTSTIQKFKLVEGKKVGTYGFESLNGNTIGQYLYASSSNSNDLNSEDNLSDNSSWAISFIHGESALIAQGTNANNTLRFNGTDNPPSFACYENGQSPISLHVDEDSIPSTAFETFDHVEINSDNAQTSYFVGEEFTYDNIIVVAYDESGIYKIVTTYDVDTANGYKLLESDKGYFKVTVTVTLNNIAKSASYYVEVKSPKLFAKVISETRVKVDKIYALASDEGAASTDVSSFIKDVNIIYDEINNTFDEVTHLQTFKLVAGSKDNSYAFKLLNGPNKDKYYGYISGNNVSLEDEVTTSSSWYINIVNSEMNIVSVLNENRILVYNQELGRFIVTTSGVPAILYESTTSDIVAVDSFVSRYMYPKTSSGSECTGECITKDYYETVKKAFNNLNNKQRQLFVYDEEYKVPYAKLVAWASANGDVFNTTTNTIGPASNGASDANLDGLKDGNIIMLIVIISLVSVSVLGGAFYLRKREKK